MQYKNLPVLDIKFTPFKMSLQHKTAFSFIFRRSANQQITFYLFLTNEITKKIFIDKKMFSK